MEESELTEKIALLSQDASAFNRLVELASVLRKKCPWDRIQTPMTLRSTLIEETFEAVDAITEKDSDHVCEELGDVFFNLVFIARCFEEQEEFNLSISLNEVCEKLVRRHPHIFGNLSGIDVENAVDSASDVKKQWDLIKTAVEGRSAESVLDSVPAGFPPLMKAYKVLKKAAGAGFDWRTTEAAEEKVTEEFFEFRNSDEIHREEEIGDLLLSVINLSRKHGVDPSIALEKALNKFSRRFRFVEKKMKENNLAMKAENDQTMMDFWKDSKNIENKTDF